MDVSPAGSTDAYGRSVDATNRHAAGDGGIERNSEYKGGCSLGSRVQDFHQGSDEGGVGEAHVMRGHVLGADEGFVTMSSLIPSELS